jgi:hypothetical protein
VHQDLDFADGNDQPLAVPPRRSEALTIKRGVQISRGAITNEFDIDYVDAHYLLTGGAALKEAAKALYVRKFRHRCSGSGGLRAQVVAGSNPQRAAYQRCLAALAGTIVLIAACGGSTSPVPISYRTFIEQVQAGSVRSIAAAGRTVTARFQHPVTYPPTSNSKSINFSVQIPTYTPVDPLVQLLDKAYAPPRRWADHPSRTSITPLAGKPGPVPRLGQPVWIR